MLLLLCEVMKYSLVEQVLDVDLGAQVVVQGEEHARVEPGEARQGDGVVDRREHVVLVDHAQTHAPLPMELVAVPQRQRVLRHQRHLRAGSRLRRAGW